MLEKKLCEDSLVLQPSRNIVLTPRSYQSFHQDIKQYVGLDGEYSSFSHDGSDEFIQRKVGEIQSHLSKKHEWFEKNISAALADEKEYYEKANSLKLYESGLSSSQQLNNLVYAFDSSNELREESAIMIELYEQSISQVKLEKKQKRSTYKNIFHSLFKNFCIVGGAATLAMGVTNYMGTLPKEKSVSPILSSYELSTIPTTYVSQKQAPLMTREKRKKPLGVTPKNTYVFSVQETSPVPKTEVTVAKKEVVTPQILPPQPKEEIKEPDSSKSYFSSLKEALHPLDSLVSKTIENETNHLKEETLSWIEQTKNSLVTSLEELANSKESLLLN